MKIYMAARYSRRLELCGYREKLQELGHEVTSRWLNGTHQITDAGVPIGDQGESLVERDVGGDSPEAAALHQRFAHQNYEDVLAAKLFIGFTEPPRSLHGRGGRHVEMGIALTLMKEIWIIGYRENLFCWHEDVQFFPTFEDVLRRKHVLLE